ncbi:MAG: hypothetical protein AAF388_10355 [Bacteroidota bacterium]
MLPEKIDAKNFDNYFKNLLNKKGGKNVITSRFDLEAVLLEEKLDFIIQLFFSKKTIDYLIYKILYWEDDSSIKRALNSLEITDFEIDSSYNGDENPGVLFIELTSFDKFIFKSLLINHFNFEIAEEPSLNLRIQICLGIGERIYLLDIYDDRGFDMYYLKI